MQIFALVVLCLPVDLEAKENRTTVWTALRLQQRFQGHPNLLCSLSELSKKQNPDAFLWSFIESVKLKGIFSADGFAFQKPTSELVFELKTQVSGFSAPTPFQAVVQVGAERVATLGKRFWDLEGYAPANLLLPKVNISAFHFAVEPCTLHAVLPDFSVQQTRAP